MHEEETIKVVYALSAGNKEVYTLSWCKPVVTGHKSFTVTRRIIEYLAAITTSQHCWCSGIMQDSHSCDPGSIPGQCTLFFL